MPAINARLFGAKDIERVLVNAFEEWTREDVNGAFWDDQFKEEKWRHSPYTERENGDTVGSPRDIYDLGNLYDSGINSYKYQSSATGASADWHWDAKNRSGEEYAWYVHEGKGTNYPYPRRFTDDISFKFSFRRPVGMALQLRVQTALNGLYAN
jgi:hypothetical protein